MGSVPHTCPVCGAGLEFAEEATNQEGPFWNRRNVRIGIIVAVAVAVVAVLVAVVIALGNDAQLRSNARAVADGSAKLVSGSSAVADGCIVSNDGSWLFVSEGKLWMARNTPEGGWTLEQSRDGGTTWDFAMSGNGRLLSAAMVGDALFYSLAEGSSASTLRSQSLGGAFSEYASAANVRAISATDEMVVTKSTAGTLGWLNVASGIWHDLQSQLDAAAGKAGTRVEEVSAFGTKAVAATEDGQIAIIDVNEES